MTEESPVLVLLGKKARTDLDAELILDPPKTALIIVDMQYHGANRSFGLSRLGGDPTLEAAYAWRYDRIE